MNLFAFNDENFTSLTSEEQVSCIFLLMQCSAMECNAMQWNPIHSYISFNRLNVSVIAINSYIVKIFIHIHPYVDNNI